MATYTPHEMIALSVIFMILPLIAVALRAWAVRIRNGRFTADDYVIVAAMCCAVGVSIATICGTVYGGYGSHQDIVKNGQMILTPTLKSFYKSDWTIQVLSTLTIGLSKMSVILLYRKLFAVAVFKIPSLVALAVTTSWTFVFTIVTICQCRPVSLYWDELELLWGNKCIQIVPFYEAQAVTDIILDFAILIMPIPMIWNLQMPVKQKLAVASVFLLGLIASVTSIVRLVIFFQVGSALTREITDITYITSPTFIWSLIEASLTVTSACVPTLRPVFARKPYYQGYDSRKHAYNSSGAKSNPRSAQAAGYERSGNDQDDLVTSVAEYGGDTQEIDRASQQPGIVVKSEIEMQRMEKR